MAGSGLKAFGSTTLTSSDVNTYLMQQAVMTFASSAARTTAFSTAGVTVSEGMTSYLLDSNRIDVYDGTAWIPLPVGAWTTYAPTLSGGWLNGNGTYTYAKYTQIGKVVMFAVDFTLGTTTTAGTTLTMSLPVTASSTSTMSNLRGIASIAGTIYDLTWFGASTSTITAAAYNSAGTYTVRTGITATIPGTWASTSIFRVQGFYEAA